MEVAGIEPAMAVMQAGSPDARKCPLTWQNAQPASTDFERLRPTSTDFDRVRPSSTEFDRTLSGFCVFFVSSVSNPVAGEVENRNLGGSGCG